MKEKLEIISRDMESLGVNYAFMEWTAEVIYPYFIGEYTEVEAVTEEGFHEYAFILTGFTRGTWLELEEAKEAIEAYFSIDGETIITDTGSGVAILYANSFPVQTGDGELKRIQINLKIKEWRV